VLIDLRSQSWRVNPVRRAPLGFTLIELAVAITLMGVLIAAGLPSFMAWIGNSKIRTVADALRDGVHRAQTEAVRLNQSVVLSFTNAEPALNAPAVAGGANWSVQTVAQFDRVAQFVVGGKLSDTASNVTINTNGQTALCFNSSGRLMDNATPGVPGAACVTAGANPKAFDINQAKADRPLRVLVALGGQIRMCDPNRPVLSATSPEGCP